MTFIEWLSVSNEYLLVLASLCTALGVLFSSVHKGYKAVKKPHSELVSHMNEIEERLDHCDACLKNDNERIGELESDNKLILRGLMQLITHTFDGNHVDKLAEIRDEMQDYLIER